MTKPFINTPLFANKQNVIYKCLSKNTKCFANNNAAQKQIIEINKSCFACLYNQFYMWDTATISFVDEVIFDTDFPLE